MRIIALLVALAFVVVTITPQATAAAVVKKVGTLKSKVGPLKRK